MNDMPESHTYTEELSSVKTELKEIKQLLAGSSLGEKGLIWHVFQNQQTIQDLEDYKKKLTGYVIGTAAGTSGIVGAIVSLLG